MFKVRRTLKRTSLLWIGQRYDLSGISQLPERIGIAILEPKLKRSKYKHV